jgi:hypothetical protein
MKRNGQEPRPETYKAYWERQREEKRQKRKREGEAFRQELERQWEANREKREREMEEARKQARKREREQRREQKLEHRLALELIDSGYKLLATRLHPDKGGSLEAMTRLNAVRDKLKGSLKSIFPDDYYPRRRRRKKSS